MKGVVLLLLLHLYPTVFASLCPSHCICQDNSVHCSCEESGRGELTLSALGLGYIHSLTIHSCAKVTLTNDSLTGAILSHRLEFMHIGRLLIEPHAFRGMHKTPRTLVIDNCHIPVLMTNSMTGLRDMEHLWFRNSTIGTIEPLAFKHVSNIDYIYFRDSNINHISENAFSMMHSVNHLFLRGRVTIAESGAALFRNSTIHQLRIEDAKAAFDQGAFTGTQIHSTHILASRINFTIHGDESYRHAKKPKGTMLINNTSIDIFVPLLFADFKKIELRHSFVERIRDSDATSSIGPVDITFNHSSITAIESHALSLIAIHNIHFHHCLIERMERGVFSGSEIDNVTFVNTNIKKMSENMFAEAMIGRFEMIGSNVREMGSNAFASARAGSVHVERSHIEQLTDRAFANITTDTFKISHSRFLAIGNHIFADTKITHLSVTHSSLTSLPDTFISGRLPVHFSLHHCELSCTPADCEVNRLFLHPPPHSTLWRFYENTCRNSPEQTSFCPPRLLSSPSASCRLHWVAAECICSGNVISTALPEVNASLLIVGDCDEIRVDSTDDAVQALYLYRTAGIRIMRAPPRLKTISVFHSSLSVEPHSMSGLTIHSASFHNTKLDVAADALHNTTIEQLKIIKCRVPGWSDHAMRWSRVRRLLIDNSRVRSTGDLLRYTDVIELDDTLLGRAEGVQSAGSLRLRNTTILCCCGQQEIGMCDRSEMSKECHHFFPNTHKCTNRNSEYYTYQLNSVSVSHVVRIVMVATVLCIMRL